MKIHSIFLIVLIALLSGCSSPQFKLSDVDDWQPEIVANKAPDTLTFKDSLEWYTKEIGLNEFEPIVPTFNGKGNLLASWNPGPGDVKTRPTFVVIHGGHGLTAADFGEVLWLRKRFSANVLILDSYWSRGKLNNFQTWNKYGANMRALDALAAGKWLHDVKGINPNSLFLMGDSQGGWTVLRTFTDEPFYVQQGKGLFRGGIALYPNCVTGVNSYVPSLSPYWGPVIIFTGGRDTATPYSSCSSDVFNRAAGWTNYPDATHGFDTRNRLFRYPPRDGECHGSANNFQVCRNNAAVNDMSRKIVKFVTELTGMNFDKELQVMRETKWEQSSEHYLNKPSTKFGSQ